MKKILLSVAAALICVLIFCGCEALSTDGAQSGAQASTGGEPSVSESAAKSERSEPSQEESSEGFAENSGDEEQNQTETTVVIGKSGSIWGEFSDMREFVLSEQAAQLALSLVDGKFTIAEPCAYYENIATYKISGDDDNIFCTFKLENADKYTMEILSCCENRYISGFEGEFYPAPEDGYPAEAFSSCGWQSLIECDLGSPEKVEFTITAVGSGQACVYESEVRRMRGAVESARLLPIERFLTSADRSGTVSDTLSYYKKLDDEKPYFVFYTDWLYVETENGMSRIYYPERPTEYKDRVLDVYFEICNERIAAAEQP